MNQRKLLNILANETARELELDDDIIMREIRDADDLDEAKRRLLSILNDTCVALRIIHNAERQ